MADEIRVQESMQINNGNFSYRSVPTSFTADQATPGGMTPGEVTATTSGTVVDFSQLSALGGMCRLQNIDPTNYVTYGVKVGAAYIPYGELLPGEFTRDRLSRLLLTGESGTAHIHDLYVKANVASCKVLVLGMNP